MDKREREQIGVNSILERMMNHVETAEDLGGSRRIIEHLENKGYNVEKYKRRQEYKEFLMFSITCN